MKALDRQEGGDHYKKLAIQPAEYCHRNGMGGLESYVVKYITRFRDKGGLLDLNKAKHCIDLLIGFEYPESEAPEREPTKVEHAAAKTEKARWLPKAAEGEDVFPDEPSGDDEIRMFLEAENERLTELFAEARDEQHRLEAVVESMAVVGQKMVRT